MEQYKEIEAANAEQKRRLSALTAGIESLQKRTFEITDELGTLKNLAAAHLQAPVLLVMIAKSRHQGPTPSFG